MSTINLNSIIRSLPQRGLLINLAGIDGCGKTSTMDGLTQVFQNAGREVIKTREIGGTPLAEKLRAMVLNDSMDPLTEALLAFAARRDHIQQIILPALDKGAIVLTDRFTDCTFAYQGAGRGFDKKVLNQLEHLVQQDLQPDLTLWFDLPAEIAAQRRAAVRDSDRFEALDTEFFNRVREGYQLRMDEAPHRFIKINALQSKENVWLELCEKMGTRIASMHRHRRSAP